MWKELQRGWLPPKNCTKEQFTYVKEHMDVKPYVSGFIGFGCSYAGKWFDTYAKDNSGRNYCLNAYNSTMKKLKHLMNVKFYCKDYAELDIPLNSIVYIDKPYEDTTPYSIKEVGIFDHILFWKWVRDNSSKYTILVSEYIQNVPDDFEIVWQKESKQDLRNKYGEKPKTTEVLVKYKVS